MSGSDKPSEMNKKLEHIAGSSPPKLVGEKTLAPVKGIEHAGQSEVMQHMSEFYAKGASGGWDTISPEKPHDQEELTEEEAKKRLPRLMGEALAILPKLEQNENWESKKAQLDKKDREAFDQVDASVEKYIDTGALPEDALIFYKDFERCVNLLHAIYIPQENIGKTDTKSIVSDFQSSDKLQVKDTSEVGASDSNPRLGWQGTSLETFEGLLKEVSNLDMSKQKEKLEDYIYALYVQDLGGKEFSNPITDNEYKQFFLDRALPEGMTRDVVEGYCNFRNKGVSGDTKYERRFLLNIHPDRIMDVTKEIVPKIAELPYVSRIKIACSKIDAIHKMDNAVIYFYDVDNNERKENLGALLRPYAKDTRPRHPAMTEPISSDIQGIAFADQSKGGSFGDTRIGIIAQAALHLHSKGKLSFETLLPEVKARFKEHGINPEAPQWNIHEKEE